VNARIKTHSKIQVEPLVTRVALRPFLAGMNREQLALLTDCARPVHFEKGQIIFREGEIANRFYLIEAGKVVLESSEGLGNPAIIDTITPGDLLGWSWMFPPYTWQFTARAVESTAAIFFYGNSPGILREGPLARLRAFEADECCDGKMFAGCSQKHAHFPRAQRTLLNSS
jgi:hypothetical protein